MLPRQQRMQRDGAAQGEELQCLKARDEESEQRLRTVDQAAIEHALARIEARDEELQAKTYELDAKEARLAATFGDGLRAAAGPVAEAHWAALAAERQALAGRWMCLAQDKKLVVAQRHALRSGGGSGGEPQPFEPGSLPISDVCCAIVAHQVDIPLSSCCFQR